MPPEDGGGGDGLRVFLTEPEDPESGRVFVQANGGWYERAVEETGTVAPAAG